MADEGLVRKKLGLVPDHGDKSVKVPALNKDMGPCKTKLDIVLLVGEHSLL